MKRREFLGAAVVAALPWRRLRAEPAWRTFEVTTRAEILKPQDVSRAWLPLPLRTDTDWQRSLGNTWGGNAVRMTEVKVGKYGVPIAGRARARRLRNPGRQLGAGLQEPRPFDAGDQQGAALPRGVLRRGDRVDPGRPGGRAQGDPRGASRPAHAGGSQGGGHAQAALRLVGDELARV